MKKEKGFAISIILYSLVFLIITALFIILGILKTRYGVSDKIRKSVIESVDEGDYADVVFKRNLSREKKTRLPIWIDIMDTPNNIRDNIYYIVTPQYTTTTDTNTIVSNYVWYSGKLWRIVAIYPDRTMKLVTDKVIATINYGGAGKFDSSNGSSVIYQWLNEDFLDTLYNSDEIVADTVWNYTADDGEIPSRPETLPNQETVTAKVGLLNAYEYYHTGYTPSGATTFYDVKYNHEQYALRDYPKPEGSYLYRKRNEGAWWLLTRHHGSYVWTVDTWYSDGSSFSNKPTGIGGVSYGIRPSIKIKFGVRFNGGDGTKDNPYTIANDRDKPVYNETLLNTRSSGEYVRFYGFGGRYRIVGLDNNNTRLILDGISDFTSDVKSSSSGHWGASTNDAYDHGRENQQRFMYADYYFNNVWYNSIPAAYKNMIVDGNYYMGKYDTSDYSYKSTICKNFNPAKNPAPTVKECTKYVDNENMVFVGKVGLPRIGQMFSSSFIPTGLSIEYPIMPSKALLYYGDYDTERPYYNRYRPCITLSSSVKITGGNGTFNSPFEISL